MQWMISVFSKFATVATTIDRPQVSENCERLHDIMKDSEMH